MKGCSEMVAGIRLTQRILMEIGYFLLKTHVVFAAACKHGGVKKGATERDTDVAHSQARRKHNVVPDRKTRE